MTDEELANEQQSDDEAPAAERSAAPEPADAPAEVADEPLEAADERQAELQVLKEEVERFQAEARENYDKYLRAVAEMENVKKRAKKERADLLRYAGEGLARELLEVVDSLELALKQREAEGEANEFSRGIELIRDQFLSTFERFGIKCESSLGKTFDPELHEAMVSVPTAAQAPGTIIEEYKKAYRFRDKLLRVAQVVVAAQPEGDQPASSEDEEQPAGEAGDASEAG